MKVGKIAGNHRHKYLWNYKIYIHMIILYNTSVNFDINTYLFNIKSLAFHAWIGGKCVCNLVYLINMFIYCVTIPY